MTIDQLECRDNIGSFLNNNGLTGVAAEVGSLSGGYARQIMKQWNGNILHMIDPWAPQDQSVYKERQDWTDFNACYEECKKLAEEYKPRILLHRKLSLDAVSEFADNFLDFVYIDANHAYEAAAADFRAWWPKIRSGGILGAHDYWLDIKWPAWGEVKKVVDDWSAETGHKFHYTPECGSVWFVKP